MSKCIIGGCNRAIKHPESGLCGPCYQGLWYWSKKKSVTQRVKRKQALKVYESRMDFLDPTVAVLQRRKS